MSPSKRRDSRGRPAPTLEPPEAVRTPSEEQWRERAACRGMDPNFFFPYRGVWGREREHVVDICRECPVRLDCLEEGLTASISKGRLMDGIWGGFGRTEREVMVGIRYRGTGYEKVAPRIRRVLQREPEVVSLLARYRRGELSGQAGPETDSAA